LNVSSKLPPNTAFQSDSLARRFYDKEVATELSRLSISFSARLRLNANRSAAFNSVPLFYVAMNDTLFYELPFDASWK
jgi:hypothetical protein